MTGTPANPIAAAVAPGYQFEGPALELGGLVADATELTDHPVPSVKSDTFQYAVKYATREAVRGMFRIGRR